MPYAQVSVPSGPHEQRTHRAPCEEAARQQRHAHVHVLCGPHEQARKVGEQAVQQGGGQGGGRVAQGDQPQAQAVLEQHARLQAHAQKGEGGHGVHQQRACAHACVGERRAGHKNTLALRKGMYALGLLKTVANWHRIWRIYCVQIYCFQQS